MDGMTVGMAAAAVALLLGRRMLGSGGVASISPAAARELMESGGCLLLDVRSAGEWRSGRIAGAVHIPLPEIGARWTELPADRPVVVYCASGMRSRSAAGTLLQKGLGDVRNLAGGISAWQGQGLPVER